MHKISPECDPNMKFPCKAVPLAFQFYNQQDMLPSCVVARAVNVSTRAEEL